MLADEQKERKNSMILPKLRSNQDELDDGKTSRRGKHDGHQKGNKREKKKSTVINQKLIHQPRKAPQRKPNQERRNHKTKKKFAVGRQILGKKKLA